MNKKDKKEIFQNQQYSSSKYSSTAWNSADYSWGEGERGQRLGFDMRGVSMETPSNIALGVA